MDGHRFDGIARVVAEGTSRRKVLGLISAGIASVAAHISVQNAFAGCPGLGESCDGECCPDFVCDSDSFTCVLACADIGEPCGTAPVGGPVIECCNGFCNRQGICEDYAQECGGEGDNCFNPSEVDISGGYSCCTDGLECLDGTCQTPEPQCIDTGESCVPVTQGSVVCCDKGASCIDGVCLIPEPVCIETGETCFDGEECCDPDAQCIAETCMIPEPECIEEGESCAADEECCTGICCGGFCRDIECCIDDENPNDRCDDGQSCFEGICEGVSEICESDDDCADETCCCDDGSCSADCCEEDDDEEVTQLPNTGSGNGRTGAGGWFGAAAIGAAAAFLGGKKLQHQEQPVRIEKD